MVRVHDLKHTFGRRLRAAGVSFEDRQDLLAETGGENTYLESVSAVSAKLLGNLALVASFTVKHNTEVPVSLEKTDTYTALSLEYVF